MIVPLAAGSGLDTIGRLLAERIRRSLGQPFIIENVSGAEGGIGTGRAARARPDGYTIELGFKLGDRRPQVHCAGEVGAFWPSSRPALDAGIGPNSD